MKTQTKNNIFKDISIYLENIGANLIETTNSYEIARFIANDETCVIYEGKRGLSGSNSLSNKIISAFIEKKLINIQDEKRRPLKDKFYNKLIERDGNRCFYTGQEMNVENASIEHLIPLSRGGKNNMDNLVLCLKEINADLANKSLVEKIKFKMKMADTFA